MIDWLLDPAVALAVALALVYTLAIHLFLGLGYRRLPRHWLLAVIGMAVGAGVAIRVNSQLPLLGDLHIVESSLVALGVLLLTACKVKLGAPVTPTSAES